MSRFINYIILIVLLCHIGTTAQKPFKQLVNEFNDFHSLYESIYPNSGPVALQDVGISYQTLIKEFSGTEEFKLTDNDSIEASDLKYYYELKTGQKFKEVMHHPELVKHDLSQLIPSMLVSEDKKFYCLSMDENTGGSYHSRITMYHHIDVPVEDETAFDNFARDGYYEIFTLKTKQGTKYLLIGTVITCNTCMAAYALLTHFKDGKFVHDFETMIDGRMGREIIFDPKTKILSVNYSTDDLLRKCFCEHRAAETDADPYDTKEELIIHNCSCKYKFDGNTFTLVSHRFEIAKE